MEQWLESIEQEALKLAEETGDRISPYYYPKVGKKFMKIARNFLLWSSVLVQKFGSPYLRASSASVESEFAILKKKILKNEEGPLPLHKFVAKHLDHIVGDTKLTLARKEMNDCNVTDGWFLRNKQENRSCLNHISFTGPVASQNLIKETSRYEHPNTSEMNSDEIDDSFPDNQLHADRLHSEFLLIDVIR